MNEHSNLLDRHNKYLRYLLVLSFITFVILVAATSAQGACLSIDAVSSGTTASDTSSSMTISHTTGSDSDRLMLVAISFNDNDDERVATTNGVTYGGTVLTKVGERYNDNDAMVYIYSLVAPNPGTDNVVITFSSALNYGAIAGVMTFTGVHQSTPLGTFASAIGNDTTTASVDISSAPGELVFGIVANEYDAITTAITGQDVQWNTSTGFGPGSGPGTNGAGGTDVGASTVTMTWGFDAEASPYNHWAIGGISIKPSSTKKLVMVVGTDAPSSSYDSAKQTLFESWGWTVSTINDTDSQTIFNNAAASNDVMYISESSTSTNVSTKARDLDIGTVDDECWLWDAMEYGSIGDGDGDWGTTINITDNSHYITSPFSTGNLTVYTTSGDLNNLPSSLASGGQLLGQTPNGGDPTLFAFATGATLDSGTAANRRVGFPSFDANPSIWTADLKTLLQRSLDWASGCGVEGGGGSGCGTNLVMVTQTGDFSSGYDSAKKTLFESWGWTVSAIEDVSGDYSGAASSNDVMFISESSTSGEVGTQARDLNIGIMVEEAGSHDEMEFSSDPSNYQSGTTGTQIDIVDNMHYITSTLGTGALTIYSSTDNLIINDATPAPGADVLAEEIGGNDTALITIPTGATLDNGAGAANRRVGFIGMHTSNPANWTSSMETLVQRSLDWAAGCGAAGGGTNSDPVLNSIGNKSVDEGQLLEFTISATDADGGDTLTYSASNLPTGATFTPGTQTFSWTPSVGDAGTYPNVLFTVDDDGTPQKSDSEGITITVNSSGGGGLGIPIDPSDVAGYSCNMKITIDNTKVAFASSENFPVLISLTDDSLKTSSCGFVTDPDGDDIIFTNSNLTLQLYHEIEKYDETTGEIVAWVLVPALSGTTDTDIYMYFGNSSVTSPTESPTDVWDSDYAGVWHLKEDAATASPTTFDRSVATQDDDAEEAAGGGMDLSSSDLELVEESSVQQIGMRFTNMSIPPGATITNAYIEFTVDETGSVATNLTFWGQDADNPGTFTSSTNNISNRTKTSASVAWNNIPAWDTVGQKKQTPNLKTIIQEIVDRPGWASSNAMVIIVTGTGKRVADSYSDVAPLLHVEYGAVADFHLDSTSNDNDGIPNGNTLTASGKIDGAQDFDGNDYVESPDSSSLDLTSEVTLSAWIRPTSTSGYDRIVAKSHSSAGAPWTMYGLLFDNANHLRAEIASSGSQNAVDGTTVVPTNTWTYATITYDGSNIRVYFNGSEDATPTALSGSIDTNNVPLSIGRSDYDSDYFNGRIDEVRVSNVARSAAWIETSYNNQNDPLSFYSVEKNCPSTIPPIAEFTCSIPLTIDSSKVSGTSDLTNFPVLVSLTNTSLRTTGSCGYVQNSSGYDIIFSDATQTTILDHEIEKYDGASGELVAWVRVPTLKYNEDTVINIHYGHSSVCGATENPIGVWDSNYKGVWHLGDTSGATQDSTSYNTGGSVSGTVTRGGTGQIGDAFNFYTNGEVDWGDPAHLDFGSGEMTLSLWANIDNNRGSGMWEKIINKGKGSWETGYEMELDDTANNLYFSINDGSTEWGRSTSVIFSLDTWTHFVGVVDRTNNLLRLYKDGGQVDTSGIAGYGNIDFSDTLTIGKSTWGWPDARIDEVRLSNTARSADWIQTEYNNQSNPSSFYSIGASSCFLSGFSCNRRITIDSAKVAGSSDLTNFPFLLKIQNDCNLKTAANGGAVQNSSGWDIIFVDSDGVTQLDHEIEEYDGTTGDLTAWVRVPTLPYNSDKEIYLYYGKSGLTCDPSNPTGVWDSSYEAVYHLNDDFEDSTSHNRDATAEDTDTYASVIADGENFGPQDEIAIGNWNFSGDELTLQAWARFDDFDQDDPRVFSKANDTSEQNHVFMLGLGDTGDAIEHHPRLRVKTGTSDTSGTTTMLASGTALSSGNWYLIAGTYDGSNMRLLLDGVQIQSTAKTGNLRVNSWNIALGNHPGGTSSTYTSMDGQLDEVRVLSVARSADWLKTEYNNQDDPDSFYSMSQDTCGGAYGFNFQYCKKITVDHTQVSGDLTRYPLLINITGDDDLKTVANGGRIQHSQGWDIVFRTSGCGNLDHEIEKYDGANGDLVAWVQIPTLSSSTDTEIYMYYGATVICDTSNPTAVWDARFRGVYHLNDDFNDSTQYNHDGTNNGATFTASKIGNGALFTPSNGWDYIDLGTWSMSTADITLQAWVWPNDFNQNDPRIVTKCSTSGSSAQDHVYMLSLYNGDNGENRMRFRVKTGTDDLLNTVELFGTSPNGYLPSAQSWYFLAGTYEDGNSAGTEMRMLRDEGLDAGQVGHAGSLRENSWPVWIGASPHGTNNSDRAWDGILDEVRILSSDLSQAWLETEYRNHNDPGNFYTITSCFEQTTEVTQEWVEEVQ